MAKGEYQTKTRMRMMDFLKESSRAVTVDEIHAALSDIDLSTIYRNVERMVEEGTLLQFAGTGGGKPSYQLPLEEGCHHHLHLKCTVCGKVIHLDCAQMQEFTDHIKTKHGFTLSYDDTVLYGICQDCMKKQTTRH
jgi:Fur family ferric uptake transcriptional regulator